MQVCRGLSHVVHLRDSSVNSWHPEKNRGIDLVPTRQVWLLTFGSCYCRCVLLAVQLLVLVALAVVLHELSPAVFVALRSRPAAVRFELLLVVFVALPHVAADLLEPAVSPVALWILPRSVYLLWLFQFEIPFE